MWIIKCVNIHKFNVLKIDSVMIFLHHTLQFEMI